MMMIAYIMYHVLNPSHDNQTKAHEFYLMLGRLNETWTLKLHLHQDGGHSVQALHICFIATDDTTDIRHISKKSKMV